MARQKIFAAIARCHFCTIWRMADPITEIDILWITAGLGCDGDTIAMTAATQPSIEDLVLGGIPGLPKIRFHNPVLASETVHEGCDRGGYYEQGDFAATYGTKPCIVKLGCWGPVVQCNVAKRGWMGGIGGCPNVGGICIGCTMPGFPDKFMAFMDQPPGSMLSSQAIQNYGKAIRALRAFTQASMNKEPSWRKPARDA
jgi:Ni,Fe-hydrogenase I small subunit